MANSGQGTPIIYVSSTDSLEITNSNKPVNQQNDASPNLLKINESRSPKTGSSSQKRSPFDVDFQGDFSDVQSTQTSPLELQPLTEIVSPIPLINLSGHLDESRTIVNIPLLPLESDEYLGININNKISKILIEPKSDTEVPKLTPLCLETPPVRIDLSLLMGGDMGAEAGNNDNPNLPVWKRNRKKAGGKVTFDDSLNTDIVYDPNESCVQTSTRATDNNNGEKDSNNNNNNTTTKPSGFISVYARQGSNDSEKSEKAEKSESDIDQTKPKRKNSPNIEFRAERFKQQEDDEEEEQEQANRLYEGVDEQSDEQNDPGRLSKLTEEQAAKIFEKRKNNIFKGLKKLNKNKTSLVSKSPQATTFSKAKRLTETKTDPTKPQSADSANLSLNPQKLTTLFIENPDKIRSPKSFERKSLTPQKLQRTAPELSPRKPESAKSLTVQLKRSSRSFSQEELRRSDISIDNALNRSAVVNGTKMIDEMFKLAREDVQKRIASIDKRLIENEKNEKTNIKVSKEELKKSAKVEPPKEEVSKKPAKVESREDINKKPAKVEEVQKSAPAPVAAPASEKKNYLDVERKSAPVSETGLALEDSIVVKKAEPQKSPIPKKRVPEPPAKEQKPVTDVKRKIGGSQERLSNNKNNIQSPYTVVYPKGKDKPVMLNKTELGFLSNKERYAKELVNKGMQQPQSTLNSEVSLDYDKKHMKLMVTPPPKEMSSSSLRFTEPELLSRPEILTMERNSYSQIYDKERKTYLSPKEPPKESLKGFKQLENVLKTYAVKESPDKRNYSGRTPIKVTEMRDTVKELESYKINNRKEMPKSKEKPISQERGDQKEVKQFTLRPQSAEKVHDKKSNNSFTRKPLDQSCRTTPTKDVKDRISYRPSNAEPQSRTEKYSSNTLQVPEAKIPRSHSDQQMKVLKPTKPSSSILNDSAQDFYQDMSLISTKSTKSTTATAPTTSKYLSPKNIKYESPRNKNGRNLVSPTAASKNLSKSLFQENDNTLHPPKAVYLRSLFSVQKPSPNDFKQARRSQNKSCNSVLNAENVEELLKQNHKVIGIRNNQYVFAKFAN